MLSWGFKAIVVQIVVQNAFNRSDLINTLLEHVEMDKRQAVAVLDTLKDIMVAHLVPGAPSILNGLSCLA